MEHFTLEMGTFGAVRDAETLGMRRRVAGSFPGMVQIGRMEMEKDDLVLSLHHN